MISITGSFGSGKVEKRECRWCQKLSVRQNRWRTIFS
jgi:hypothetical protein